MTRHATPGRALLLIAVSCLGLLVLAATHEPQFLRWLRPHDPGDETILVYWKRVEAGQATPVEMVDLGTMLFHRGFPKDALRMYQRAVATDPTLAQAWLHTGLVEHALGHERAAERAYRKCLHIAPHTAWCHFYLGLLLEKTDRIGEALDEYTAAFTIAPELADPSVNPELRESEIEIGAMLRAHQPRRFITTAPLTYSDPKHVSEVMKPFLPTPTPAPTPTATPIPHPPIVETAPATGRELPSTPRGTHGVREPRHEPGHGRKGQTREPGVVVPRIPSVSGTGTFPPG